MSPLMTSEVILYSICVFLMLAFIEIINKNARKKKDKIPEFLIIQFQNWSRLSPKVAKLSFNHIIFPLGTGNLISSHLRKWKYPIYILEILHLYFSKKLRNKYVESTLLAKCCVPLRRASPFFYIRVVMMTYLYFSVQVCMGIKNDLHSKSCGNFVWFFW